MLIEDYGSLVYFAVTVVAEHFPKFQGLHNYHVPPTSPRLS